MIFDTSTVVGLLGVVISYLIMQNLHRFVRSEGRAATSRFRIMLVYCGIFMAVKWLMIDQVGFKSNHYAVLGVHRTAELSELKKGYKNMAREHHPDKVSSQNKKDKEAAELRFNEIKRASDILVDDKMRDIYNRFGDDPVHLKFDPRQDPSSQITHISTRQLLWGLVTISFTASEPRTFARNVVLVFWACILAFELVVSLTPWCLPAYISLTEREVVDLLLCIYPVVLVLLTAASEYLFFVDVRGKTEDSVRRLTQKDAAIVGCMNAVVHTLNTVNAEGGNMTKGLHAVGEQIDEALKQAQSFDAEGLATVRLLRADRLGGQSHRWMELALFAGSGWALYMTMEYIIPSVAAA